MLKLLKFSAKKLRPLFIPVLRVFVRYSPYKSIKKFVWTSIIEPFFEFTKYNFEVQTVFGSVIAGNTQDQIQRYIYYFGIWEPNLTVFIKNRLKEGDIFVDIGANIGYFSLLASTLVGKSGKVIAIEASPKIHELLIQNLKRNSCTNIETLNVAVSDKEETLKIYMSPETNIGQTTVIPNLGFTYECDMPAKPLNTIISPNTFSNVRLIKIDVEGAEWFVLCGLIPLLEYAREDIEIIVELAPDRLKALGKNVEDIITQFRSLGFYPYKIKNDYSARGYINWREIKHPESITSPILNQTDIIFSKNNADQI